jgi:hypothetical protein
MKPLKIKNGKIISGQSPTVYWGVVTPKGEPNYKISKYFIEKQVQNLPPLITGKPVFINHVREINGKQVTPIGKVISSHYIPKTGQVVSFFTLAPTQMGELAKSLLGENGVLSDEFRMGALSLGMKIKSTQDELQIPLGHAVDELSICYDPARPGCFIKGKCPLSFFSPNEGEDINEHIKQIINQINNNSSKQEIKEDEKMNKLPPAPIEKLPPPSALQGSLVTDLYKVKLPTAAPVVIEATASNSYTVSEPSLEELQKTAEQLKQQLSGVKRPIEENRLPEIKLDVLRHITPNIKYPDFVLPPDCPEELAIKLKQEYDEKKSMWEQLETYKLKEIQQRAQRLQQAAQEYLPTVIGEVLERGGTFDQDTYEKYAATTAAIGGVEYDTMLSIAEATASSNKKSRTDINKLVEDDKKKNQEIMAKLEELNKKIVETQEQKKPLFHNPKPVTQQTTTQTPSYTDRFKGKYYEIAYATASRVSDNARYTDAKFNPQQLQTIAEFNEMLFKSHGHPNIETASNRDVAGGVLEEASKIPGSKARDRLKQYPGWTTQL